MSGSAAPNPAYIEAAGRTAGRTEDRCAPYRCGWAASQPSNTSSLVRSGT